MVERLKHFLTTTQGNRRLGALSPLVLYAYHTAVHFSSGVSPFQLMFDQQPKSSKFADYELAFNVSSYQSYLQVKLAKFCVVLWTKRQPTISALISRALKLVIWFSCLFQLLASSILGGSGIGTSLL